MKRDWFSSLIQKVSRGQHLNSERPAAEVEEAALSSDPEETAQRILEAVRHAPDIAYIPVAGGKHGPIMLYCEPLVDKQGIHRLLMSPMRAMQAKGVSWDRLSSFVPIGERKNVQELSEAVKWLLSGWTLIALPGQPGVACYKTDNLPSRPVGNPEVQSIVVGPQEAFTESLETNIALIRKRLRTPHIQFKLYQVGRLTQTNVAMMYVDDIAHQPFVEEMEKRIQNVEFDELLDSGVLAQLIDDQPLSPFPQFVLFERPDATVSGMLEGKIAVLVDGTPFVLLGPSSFIEFFHSPEDYFNRWMSTSLLRILRLIGVFVSISFSAIYVAVLTFHYEVIPANMLKTIALSRAKVPFPPLYEAMFLELTLEVLREAGERLPTKVGQTMGIVGGIVIGQAAVSAGLTSNVMIIVVSLSALASFVTPSYIMGNAIRVIRFPIIVLSGLWGFIGLLVGLATILLHLLNLSSLGVPYMSPLSPLRLADLKDTLVRFPSQLLTFRPTLTRSKRDRKANPSSLRRK